MTLHKMAPVDAAWFHMEGSANLAMVTSLALTKKRLDFAKVKALYAARLSASPRFRQRVVERGLPLPTPHWEDMPNLDIGQHLHHVALPQPSDQRALELGNAFGLVLLELAVSGRTPLERLRMTKAHMDALKRSPEPVAMRGLFDIFGRTPKRVRSRRER